jgi:hypothetical protein
MEPSVESSKFRNPTVRLKVKEFGNFRAFLGFALLNSAYWLVLSQAVFPPTSQSDIAEARTA